MLINKKAVKAFAIEYAAATRPKFKMVSQEFLIYIEGLMKEKIRQHIRTLPSLGVTIK